jgi:hypothetical protein
MSTRLPGIHVPLPAREVFAPTRMLVHLSEMPASQPARAELTRRRIWELGSSFHCSIIGTCLTTAELRQILLKIGLPGVDKETDHELHGRAVLLAGKRDVGSKLLQKALDRRHRSALIQFGRARDDAELRALWANAVEKAEIPGAYWAVLTHAQTTEELARHVFGEVHMLSHLVGAANRADIRHLRELEAHNAELSDKVERQQAALREAVVTRDGIIAGLQRSLTAASTAPTSPRPSVTAADCQTGETDGAVVASLNERLAAMTARYDRLHQKVEQATTERDAARCALAAVEHRERVLLDEIAALEHRLATDERAEPTNNEMTLAGTTILYVGGHPHQIAQIRFAAKSFGATFLHHDGGLEERGSLIASLISRAHLVMFPVDCVSHAAVAAIKKFCRQMGKSYRPLRSSGRSSLLAALHEVAGAAGRASRPQQVRSPWLERETNA